jgi:DNA polymerase III sliding clamp (beta) subunit (PCNA family)
VKVTVDAKSLRGMAEFVGKHTGTSLPILAAVVLRADDAGLTASATDYETWASQTAEAHTATVGAVAVSGRLLGRVCAAMPHDGRVDLILEGSGLRLVCGSFKSRLPTLPAEDHPVAPDAPTSLLPMPAGLVRLFGCAVPIAESMEAITQEVCGVELTLDRAGVTLAACDKYRGFATTLGWDAAATMAESAAVLLPASAVGALAGLAEEGATLALGLPEWGTVLTAQAGGRTLLCRTSAAAAVQWRKFLGPVEADRSVVLDAGELADLVKRLVPTIDDPEAAKTRILKVEVGSGYLTLHTDTTDDRIEAVHEDVWNTDPWTMAIKAPYLLSVVEAAGVSTVRIGFTGPWKPWRVERADATGPGAYASTVMPVRLPS